MNIRAEILKRLSVGEFVSGAVLARTLGISRASVQQHVGRCVELGLEIHRVRGRGYRLITPVEPLLEAQINKLMGRAQIVQPVTLKVVNEVDSTNSVLARKQSDLGSGAVSIFTEHQNSGRGRRGRQWLNQAYRSLLMSYAFRLEGGAAAASGLSLVAGIACCRALSLSGFQNCGLKWPNDLMVNGKKLGGVLIDIDGEVGGVCRTIIGIGINVNSDQSGMSGISQPGTSVLLESGRRIDRNELAANLLNCLGHTVTEFSSTGFGGFVDEWQSLHVHRGKPVTVNLGSGKISGIAQGADRSGALRVVDDSGILHRITTGEVEAS